MVSICIPVYEMCGKGVEYLAELLESILLQNYKGYEVIISDNSKDDEIKDYIKKQWGGMMRYYSNPGNNPSQNLNNAINHARGEIIKPMCQDDKFTDPDTLGNLKEMNGSGWAAFISDMEGLETWTHWPKFSQSYKDLLEGENTFGSPSAIAFLNCELRFDESLIWLMDVEFYARLMKKFGNPKLIDKKVFIRCWEGQVTRNQAVGQIRLNEQEYCRQKHLISDY